MDISALSEEKFDAVDWINENFKKFSDEKKLTKVETSKSDAGVDNETSVEFINSYVSKLQLYVQQVNYAVEENSQQLGGSMPRIVKDAKALHSDVKDLQERMLLMRQEVAAVQEETGECMATLERLNTQQCKLQTAKESLQESDGWGNLISELEDSFERNDLKSVCDKIAALQKSLQAQEQLPGHAERQSQVEDFKNRLEALASPSVVQCFAEGSIEQAQRYVNIFATIQRNAQLLQYYRAVQKTALQQQWKQTLEMQSTETAGQQQHFLTLYYDQLLENCQKQVKWCTQVFDDADDAMQQPFILLAELLPSLQPSRDSHILQLLKTCNERLDLLQQFAQANHTFVLQLNAYLEQSSIKLSPELKQQLGTAIYEYFHKFIQQFPRLEETQLSTQVDRVLITQPHASDAVRHLKDITSKLFDWLNESLSRCSNITSDLALCKFIYLLGGIFKRLLEQFSKTQRQLTLNIGSNNSNASADSSWSMLQYTLALLECLADYQQRLQKFEKTLQERLTQLEHRLKGQQMTNINIYQTFESGEQQRILATIADFQQKRLESTQDNPSSSVGIFANIYDSLKSHFTETHDITLNILLQPLESHLAEIQPRVEQQQGHMQDMPAFSFAPQECITQIGQYLLTLPQHLEPLLLAPSTLLKQALEMCNIKYSQPIPSADILLSLVVAQCCVSYQLQILHIKSLPNSASKQMSVDIEYLSSVIEELGLTLTTSLAQILTLLKAAPENYLQLSAGCEPRLVTAIRQMRNIISTHLIMADITSQPGQLRTKLGDIVEHSSTALNEATEVTKGLRNVVGWLKQASIEVREAGKRAVTQIQSSNPNFLSNEFDLDDPDLLSPTASSTVADESKYDTKSLSNQDITRSTRHSLSQPQSPRARGRVDNFTAGYHRSTSIITQLEKSKILLKMSDQNDKPLTILHYNDVYNVDSTTEKEPIGGAARFCTAIRTFHDDDPLVLFSGDIFSPSMLSTFTQGEQMVPVLNSIGTHCAVFGNHDFDHGLDVLVELIKKNTFPWLMSNVVDNETGRPLGGGKISHYIFHNQISIGLIGLVEKEWLETLPTIDPKEVTYIDYVEAGNKLAAELRNEGCELIIALTHMRTPNDINLAQHCPGIDLILGGHDHVYEIKDVNGIKIIKSGTDFRQFSKISIQKDRDENGKIKLDVEAIDVTAKYAEDEVLKKELATYSEVIESKMTEVLGIFTVELDGRFSTIRTQETNLGDWVCDVALAATGADVALINSGTFRSDQIHPPGPFTMRDLVNIIPMRDPLILLEISGKRLYEALENSVSSYPKLEGRFPQVSGVTFAFDPTKPPGKRIDAQLVQVGDEYLNMEQNYKICIKSYIYNGCDGFTMFKDAKVLMDDDSCPELGLTVQNHFKAINLRTGKGGHHTKHRQSLVTLSRRHSMVQMLDNLELDGPSPIRKLSAGHQTKSIDLSNTNCSKMLRRASLDDLEQASCQLAPKIQHRIIRIQNDEHHNQLLMKKETSIKNTTIAEDEDE